MKAATVVMVETVVVVVVELTNRITQQTLLWRPIAWSQYA